MSNDFHSKNDGRSLLPSLFEVLCHTIKEYAFTSHYLLLKYQFKSLSFEIFNIIVQTIQVISFAFRSNLISSWKPLNYFHIIDKLLQYFHLVIFLENKTNSYFIFFYYLCILIGFSALLEWILLKRMSNKSKAFTVLLNVLQIILYFMSTILYIPIIRLLLSIFECGSPIPVTKDNNVIYASYNLYANTFQCWQSRHYMHISFGLFFLILFLIKTLLFTSTYCETNYDKHNPVAKRTSSQDFISKVIILFYIILSTFISTYLTDCLVIIVVMGILSLVQLYYYFIFSPHYNQILLNFNFGSKIIISWSFICVFIGRLLQSIESFNCNIWIFLVAIPIIFLIIFSKEPNQLEELLLLSRRLAHGRDFIRIAEILLEQLDNMNKRSTKIILPGYASFIESTCTSPECALKKYMLSINSNKEASIFLLKHIEMIYNNGINKYPFYIPLRISYCRFLIERMNRKQYAFNELETISFFPMDFEEQFIVFRYKKLYEEYGYFKFKEYETEIFNFNVYTQLTHKFQALIIKVSLLYIDFWTLLYQNHNEHQQDLTRLNYLGAQIHINVNELDDLFIEVNKEIHNDKDLLLLYYDFVSEVLHDTHKKKSLKKKILELEEIVSDEIAERKLEHFDIHQLAKTDKFLYMIINGQYESLGRIINLSLSLCSYLGYTKKELCGTYIDALIPGTLEKGHQAMMKSKVDGYVKQGNDFAPSKLEYHDIIAFAINKSRYLIPFSFKQCYIHTENKEDYWLLKMIKDQRSSPTNKTCYVITDCYMNIQHFTGNSLALLGLNSFTITNSIDITKAIKEFHEEYYRKILDQEDKSLETKLNVKRMLLLEKFRTPMIVTWKRIDYQSFKNNDYYKWENIGGGNGAGAGAYKEINTLTPSMITTTATAKDFFFLSVTKLELMNEVCGFLFSFDPIQGIIGSPSPQFSHKRLSAFSIDSTSHVHTNQGNEQGQGQGQTIRKTQSSNKYDKSLLPTLDSDIRLNPTKLSYTINNRLINNKTMSRTNVIEYLQKEAYEKLKVSNKNNTEQGHLSESSNLSVSSSYDIDKDDANDSDANQMRDSSYDSESSGNSPYDNKNDNKSNSNNLNSPIDHSKPQIVIGDVNKEKEKEKDSYYKVNLTNMKYTVFDYKSKYFLDQNFELISHVQIVIDALVNLHNGKSQNDSDDVKDNNNSDTSFDKAQAASSLSNEDKDKLQGNTYGNTITKGNGNNDLIKTKTFTINDQIKESLSNEESQESIINLSWISLILFLVILSNHSIFLGISLNCLSKLTHTIDLIDTSYMMIHISLLSMLHVKELLYLQYDSYNNFYLPKEEYILNNTAELSLLYLNMTSLISKLSLNSIRFSSANSDLVYNTFIQVDFIEYDTNKYSYQLTLISSFSELASALYRIIELPQSKRTQLQQDMFFFGRNIINYPFLALNNQSALYEEELNLTINSNKTQVILTFALCCFILLLTYFFIEKGLDLVIRRKESYLEVFYEIGSKVILLSLQQCYSFVQKTQNYLNEEVTDSDVDNDDSDYNGNGIGAINEGYELLLNEKGTKGKGNDVKYEKTQSNRDMQSQYNNSNSNQRKPKSSKEAFVLKVRIVIALCVTVILASTSLIIFIEYEDIYFTYVNVFIIEHQMKNNVLLGFNTIRDYMYNRTSPILGSDLNLSIDTLFNQYLIRVQDLDNEMKKYESEYSKPYFQTHIKINQYSLCNYSQFFYDTHYPNDTKYNCDTLLSGAPKYGISILLSSFFDQLNDFKNYYLSALQDIDNGNAIRLEGDLSVINEDYNFNMKELIIAIRFMILPIYGELTQNVLDEIDRFSKRQEKLFIILEICFIAISFMWFVFRWRPYLRSLSQIIFKTKNMLTIIPLEVLSSLSSIHKVLRIKRVPVVNTKKENQYSIKGVNE